ncbi:MAG: hypothetical protein I3J02_00290 [Prevotella sp.]|nr:hypothetical protein [Prevotella sp.]
MHLDKIYYANNRKDTSDIGFDIRISPLKAENRAKPMEVLLSDEALDVFALWQQKTGKTEYCPHHFRTFDQTIVAYSCC